MVLKFTSLPFIPERGQVIYVESEYNEKLNKFIRNNYASLKSDFATKVLQFCYLPLLVEETIRYNAPYVGKERPTTRTFLNLINEIMSIEKSQYNYYINVDRIVVIWIRFFNVKEIDKYLW